MRGDLTDINNHRLNNFLAKVLEYVVYDQIYPSLWKINVPNQHGFVDGRTTITDLSVYSEYVNFHVNNKTIIDSIYTISLEHLTLSTLIF